MRCVNRSSLFSSDYCSKIIRANFRLGVVVKRSFSPLWEQRNKLFSSRGESHITHVAKKSPQDDRAMEMHHPNSPPQLQTSIFVPFSSLGTLIISRSLLLLTQDLFLNVSKKNHFSYFNIISIFYRNCSKDARVVFWACSSNCSISLLVESLICLVSWFIGISLRDQRN